MEPRDTALGVASCRLYSSSIRIRTTNSHLEQGQEQPYGIDSIGSACSGRIAISPAPPVVGS